MNKKKFYFYRAIHLYQLPRSFFVLDALKLLIFKKLKSFTLICIYKLT